MARTYEDIAQLPESVKNPNPPAPVNIPVTPPSVSGQFTPRTPDGPIGTYAAELQGQPAPVAPVPAPAPTGVIAGSVLDPMGNVRKDVAGAYNQGAAVSTPVGVGMAAREAIISPVSRAMGVIGDASQAVRDKVSNVVSPIVEGARAFATGQPTAPATAAVPAPAAVPTPAAPGGVIAGSATAPAAAPAATGTVQPPPGTNTVGRSNVMRSVSIRMAPEEVTPSLAPSGPQTPAEQVLALQNDGTWSGMINAKTLAKRVDADRAAQVAAANAESGRIGALSGAMNARSAAMRGAAETSLIQENVKTAQATQAQKQQQEALTREMIDPATKPERRKEIEKILVAIHGKNPSQPQVHSTPIFDANGQKTGERLYERQGDGSWKDVTPKVALKDNPQATAIINDPKMADAEKRQRLQALGYQ